MKLKYLIILFFSFSSLFAEEFADSLSIEEIIPDSVSVIIFEPLMEHGSAEILRKTEHLNINKNDFQELSYSQMSDILYKSTNFYPLSLGSFGLFNHMSIFGSSPANINFTYNNRPINDLNHGSLNLEQISPSSYENIEIFTGSDAVIMGDNGQGAFINLQQKKYNAGIPYSRLWYAQAGFEFIAADVIYSQNFSPNWNATIDIRNLTTQGRYENQWLKLWNLKADVRWNISDLTSITFTESYTNHNMGTNGGVDAENSTLLFDDIVAVVNYNDFNERLFRHDLTASFTSILDRDSLSALNLNVYFTNSEWNRDSGNDFFINPIDSLRHIEYSNNSIGANGKYELSLLDFLFLNIGGKLEKVKIEETSFNDGYDDVNFSAYGRAIIALGDIIDVTGGTRISYLYGNSALAFGSAAIIKFPSFNLKIDASVSERVPTPSEGLSLNKENHFLATTNLNGNINTFGFNIYSYLRYVDKPIMNNNAQFDSISNITTYNSYNTQSAELYGIGFDLNKTLFSNFQLNLKTLLQYSNLNGNKDERFPVFLGSISLNYIKYIRKNKLSAGINFKLISEFEGYQFLPQTRTYIPADFRSSFANNGFDVYATAVLGDAFIKLEFMNLLSQGYYYVPYYPELNRNLKLSVAWSFLN